MISIIIRTKNECNDLKHCLSILKHQTIKNEIIVIDSNSEDKTVEIANNFDAKIIQCIPFSYGKAINIGIAKAQYENICILSAHCFPLTNDFLAILLSHFIDNGIAGVYGRQIPSRHSNLLDDRNLPIIYRDLRKDMIDDSFFNNAASLIKKSIWKDIRFEEDRSMEDIIWANEIRKRGLKIIYEPRAVVEHLHREKIEDTLKRYSLEKLAF